MPSNKIKDLQQSLLKLYVDKLKNEKCNIDLQKIQLQNMILEKIIGDKNQINEFKKIRQIFESAVPGFYDNLLELRSAFKKEEERDKDGLLLEDVLLKDLNLKYRVAKKSSDPESGVDKYIYTPSNQNKINKDNTFVLYSVDNDKVLDLNKIDQNLDQFFIYYNNHFTSVVKKEDKYYYMDSIINLTDGEPKIIPSDKIQKLDSIPQCSKDCAINSYLNIKYKDQLLKANNIVLSENKTQKQKIPQQQTINQNDKKTQNKLIDKELDDTEILSIEIKQDNKNTKNATIDSIEIQNNNRDNGCYAFFNTNGNIIQNDNLNTLSEQLIKIISNKIRENYKNPNYDKSINIFDTTKENNYFCSVKGDNSRKSCYDIIKDNMQKNGATDCIMSVVSTTNNPQNLKEKQLNILVVGKPPIKIIEMHVILKGKKEVWTINTENKEILRPLGSGKFQKIDPSKLKNIKIPDIQREKCVSIQAEKSANKINNLSSITNTKNSTQNKNSFAESIKNQKKVKSIRSIQN